jgi:hypothetical protein
MRTFRYIPVLLSLAAVPAVDAGPISSNHYRIATSISAPLESTYYADHQGITRTPGAHGSLLDLSAFPWSSRVGINAFMVRDNLLIFVPDTTFAEGADTFTRRDLVAYDPVAGTFSKYFDGAAAGIPARAGIDAISFISGAQSFAFSLDVPATLPDIGPVTQNDFLFYSFSTSTFGVQLEGQAALGLPPTANVNALHIDGTNFLQWYFSLDKPLGAGRERDVWRIADLAAPVAKLFTDPLLTTPGVDVVALDFPLDRDGDGLTDFEELSGYNETSSVLPGTTVRLDPEGQVTDPLVPDTDDDGFTDAEEALAGTDPNDIDDYLRFLNIARATDEDIVTWRSSANRAYRLEHITQDDGDLVNPVWQFVAEIPGQASSTSFTNILVNIERNVYRLKLVLDP